MSDYSKPSQLVVIIPTLLSVAAMVFIGRLFWLQGERQNIIDEWIRTYPVNAMVIDKHPTTYQLFMQHFTPYYDKGGQAGIEHGQLEMQQIINVNYLMDYVWTVKDEPLRNFVKTELALIDALVKVQGMKPGLCEQYFANSAYFDQVQQTAGGRYFMEFMLASEKLVLSAKDGVEYKMTPKHGNYAIATNAVNTAYWASFQQLHPELTTQDQMLRAKALFNPTVSCAGFAEHLRTLLGMEPSFMSLQWRVGMESDRKQVEEARHLRGSD